MKWVASDFLTESKECVFWLSECPALTGYLAVNIQEGMEGNCEVFIQPQTQRGHLLQIVLLEGILTLWKCLLNEKLIFTAHHPNHSSPLQVLT